MEKQHIIKKRVLLIDSNSASVKQIMDTLNDTFQEAIRKGTIEIDRASSLDRALEKIKEFKPTLIISDIDLGEDERNAVTVIYKEIKKEKYPIKLIVCSSALNPIGSVFHPKWEGVSFIGKELFGKEYLKDIILAIKEMLKIKKVKQ